ncbi:hypothetical protein [Nocardia noduli]|uniref:hypothetical protein n=1 Tax=Nocardia noduli TaxID=2815722 RepID=UPI001C21FB05|nr:hypothetical protein [Nocardia noduli]
MALRLGTTATVIGSELDDEPRPADHIDLVDRLVAQIPAESFGGDLALLAFALPDSRPYLTAVTHLNRLTGGRAHSLAVTGQGLGSPFTALRIAMSYERSGRTSKSVVAILESATPDVSDRPDRVKSDSGVLLTFDTTAGHRRVEEIFTLNRAEAPRFAGLVSDTGRLLVVTGPTADPAITPDDRVHVHRASEGSYCTSVWLALASNRERWEADYDVIALFDTDPHTGVSHGAILRR